MTVTTSPLQTNYHQWKYYDGMKHKECTKCGECRPRDWPDEGCKREGSKTPRTTLSDGTQIYPEHRSLKENGQQEGYIVLAEEERAKGFKRPVRNSYVHEKCGVVTRMGQTLAETYARDPYFYSGTFCCGCGSHFLVGPKGEFVWDGTNEKVGT